jgi:hypothetical protein
LYERIKREGRLSKPFAFSEGDTNIVPVMDEKLLYDGFLEVMDNIYSPEKSYERIVEFLKTYSVPPPGISIPVQYSFKEFSIVAKAFFRVGVRYRYRKYFWKLLWWSVRHNGKHLDKAVFYGIMIYQMHQTFLHIQQTVLRQNAALFPSNRIEQYKATA